jgi:cell division protein FtsB
MHLNFSLNSRKLTIVYIVVASFLVFNLGRLVYLNIENKQKVDQRNNEVFSLESDVGELEKQVDYYQTDEYLEKEARDRLNMTKPNETVYIIPENLKDDIKKEDPSSLGVKKVASDTWSLWLELLSGKAEIKGFAFDF